MSSIKKYVAGDTKEWITFGETNVLPNDLSNANNISVDFGGCESVNALLYSQQQDIEALKRNVSWLALHGGGGSGSGSGGGGTARKATCQVTINDSTKEVAVSEGQTIYVRLSNFRGSSTSVPWNIKVNLDGQNIYTGSKSLGSYDTITVPISWSMVSRYFEGTGKTKNHLMTVEATYKDEETLLEGSGSLETYIYIPNIIVTLNTKDQYNSDSVESELTASISINTALKGKFKLKVESNSYDKSLVYDSFEFNKTVDDATFVIENFMDAFKDSEGVVQYGVFSSTFYLYNENSQTGSTQLMYLTTRQIIVFSNAVDLLVSFSGLSPNPDLTKRTEIYDNVKNLFFSFYAFKNGSTEFKYSIFLNDTTDPSQLPIEVSTDKTASFLTVVSINKILEQFKTNHLYTLTLRITPTRPAGETLDFYGYIKCIQGQYSFITYSSDGELTRLFMIDSFNHTLNNEGIAQEVTLTSTTSDPKIIGDKHPISADVRFAQINARSGLIADSDNMKAIRLYDTYMDIDNKFKYTVELSHVKKIESTTVQDNKQFTIGICYQSLQYTSNDHVIFSLCNNGFINQGIVIKTDGIYVKGQKVLAVYSGNIVTVHIVYNNINGTVTKWSDDSYYKIYVNGVITFMSDKCPFLESGDDKIILNSNLKISLNGITNEQSSTRQEQCNCNIYYVEILKSIINEIDLLGSYINNRIRTTYKDYSPDFTILNDELAKNCCSYNNDTREISSSMYPTYGSERKFQFNGILLDNNGEVPYTDDEEKRQLWISRLSSLSLPITYIDLKGSSSPDLTAWTFENFTTPGQLLKGTKVETKFYYWDPKTNLMPISADSVEIKLQGTSSFKNLIKNVEITFNSREESGVIVQDLLFVKSDLIPENSYVLKADVVDSSHANNASIGRFINDQFTKGNGFGFDFDDKNIASKNIALTTTALKDNQGWNINPVLKHTVEGFLTLLLIRFADGGFRNLGIFSFNIGRNAARNLGFEYITDITDINGNKVMGAMAPAVLKNVIVNTSNEDQVFWVENSDSQNFTGVSAWNTSTTTITPDPAGVKTAANPEYNCRFWHCQQGTIEDDTKLNELFETKYWNTISQVFPASIGTFNKFVEQISKLPIEGLLKTTSLDYILPLITGGYATFKYTDLSGWTRMANAHTLNGEPLEDADINTFKPTLLASYYVIALLFGLIDNLDKNISFRIFGESQLLVDFYDMDTAFGLDNEGNENVSPAVGSKLITNYRNISNLDYPLETYNMDQAKGIFKKYSKVLPETYTNKIWMSLDSNSMRTKSGTDHSIYSNLWFKLRLYVDLIAKQSGYDSVVNFFVDKYFKSQVNCGTFIYNYDYTIKYLNDYEQTGQKQAANQISLLHGRRIDEVREWFKTHINFLDTYFFWRGNGTYIDGSKVVPDGLESVVSKIITITSGSSNNFIEIETEHPVIVNSTAPASGSEVGNTLTLDDEAKNIRVPGGQTGKTLFLNCSTLLKNFSLVDLAVSLFRTYGDSKITFIENLNLDGLRIVADGFSMNDFVDSTSQEVNALKTITMRETHFDQSFDLNLNKYQLLNVSYVDINKSTNINSLNFYKSPYDSDKTTLNLKYLNVSESQIENLTLRNLTYLVLPNVDTCNNLVTLTILNCNLDNISGSRTALSNYTNIDLSVQNSIQKVDLLNVEHIKSIRINKCPSFEELNLDGMSSLTSLTLDNNTHLNKINIIKCPLLKSIHITQCKAFKDIEILSVNNLTSLNLEYDSSLSSIKISEDSVKSITSLNLRNVDITGFNFYNYETKTYDPIIKDPLGQEVLDFSKFLALDSSGITIRKQASGDLTSDKCYNFKAIRFRNTPSKSYTMLDRSGRDGVGVRFTNLKNIYGHISLTDNGEFANGTDWFLSAESTYTGYPPFVKTLAWSSNKVDMTVFKSKTFLDKIEEKCATLKPKLEGKSDLSQIRSYISNGFIECGNDNFHEFDNREWATNYTVPTLNFLFEGRSLSEFKFQYLIYRYSINQMNNLINKTANDFHGFANYIPSDTADGQNIYFPDNTFRFIGNTLTDVRRIFSWSGTGKSSYIVTNDIMKWLTRILIYAGIGNKEILFWNALSSSSSTLTSLGNIDDHAYFTSEAIAALSGEDDGSSYDYGPNFISTLTNLKLIISFSPSLTNFRISSLVFPSSLNVMGNSFKKTPSSEVIDLSSMFQNCTNMSRIYYSFNNAQIMLKPSSFKMMPRLTLIAFNGTANKLLVEDRITLENYLSSYDENANRYYIRDEYEPEVSISCTDYTSNMFTEFVNTILTANSQLTSTDYLFANMSIPYRNIYEDDYYNKLSSKLSLNKNLFRNNTRIKSLQFFFLNAKFRYSVVSEMFSTLTALENMYCAFANTPLIAYGIESCIPYKFLYTGNIANKTINFEGSDRFENAPVSYPQFKTYVNNSFIPTTRTAGSKSYNWINLSTNINLTGLLNQTAFNDVKTTYLTGDTYVDLPTEMSNYSSYCPLATYENVDDLLSLHITPGGEPLFKTLSTIYRSLSSNVNTWKQHVCGISSTSLTHPQYRRTITNVNNLFEGNVNIKTYDGSIISEKNADFNPFILNYDSSRQLLTVNSIRNVFRDDDSWSSNGGIWKWSNDADDWVLDDHPVSGNYNANHFNSTTPDLSVLSSNSYEVKDLSGTGAQIIYSQVDQYKQAYFRDDTARNQLLVEYLLTKEQTQQFKYICSPDLFRYCIPGLQVLENVFANCDNFCNYSLMTFDADKKLMNVGLAGRIPPNLFRPFLGGLRSIARLFKNCYHITGYESINSKGERASYLIPAKLFEKNTLVYCFDEAFSGMTIKYNPDLITPFSYIMAGNSSNGTKISIGSTFSRCIWCNVNITILNLFALRWFSNINSTFYNILGTKTSSPNGNINVRIAEAGATIGSIPTFKVFTSTRYVPQRVTSTYYGASDGTAGQIYKVDNSDVVRKTLTTTSTITPSA